MQELLQGLRNQVNTIDEELVYLLYRRFEIIKEIWMIPVWENLGMNKESRKQELLDIMLEEAKDKWMDFDFVKELHELVYAQGIKIQK